jgi:hypothetical protein
MRESVKEVRYEECDNLEFMAPLLRQLTARRRAFEVLRLPEDAPLSRIKAAFRQQAKRLHPDVGPRDPQAEAKLQLVLAAYHFLSGQGEASPILCDAEPVTLLPELSESYFSWWRRHFVDLY